MKSREVSIVLPEDMKKALDINRQTCIGLIDKNSIMSDVDPLSLKPFDKISCSPSNERTLSGCRIGERKQADLEDHHSFLNGCIFRNSSCFFYLLEKHGVNLKAIT